MAPSPHFFRNYPEARFGGFSDVDGTVRFYLRVNALLRPDATVLDVGCGVGQSIHDPVAARRELQQLRGRCAAVIGIDPDPRAASNPRLDEFRLIRGSSWPVKDQSVDLALADFVLEHVEDPKSFFAEARRVLKSGGYLCLRTPNVRSYFGVLSRLLPHRGWIARAAGRGEVELFPTLYRCNTRGQLMRALRENGFTGVVTPVDAEPTYLEFHGLVYWLGVLHQRHMPRWFRLALFAFAQRR
jgi:SAM-dependent methyltransferase